MSDEQHRQAEGHQGAEESTPVAPQQAPAAIDADTPRKASRKRDCTTVAIAFFTLVSAISTVIYTYSFIRSERVYLIIEDVRFIDGADPTASPGGFDVRVTIKNSGRHVAIVTHAVATVLYGIIHKSLAKNPDYGEAFPFIIPPIAPGEVDTVRSDILDIPMPITKEQLVSGVIGGTIPVWYFGQIKYETGYLSFGKGEVGFCMKYVPPNQRRGVPGSFLTCQEQQYTYIR
jgi:hypothetical protein